MQSAPKKDLLLGDLGGLVGILAFQILGRTYGRPT